jgi:hypothetical protein
VDAPLVEVDRLTVSKAVRELLQTLHESQQSFAYRMQTAVRTIARYETVRPPRGAVLAQLESIALETGRADLAAVFRQALTQELDSPPHLLDLRITKKKRGKK